MMINSYLHKISLVEIITKRLVEKGVQAVAIVQRMVAQ